MFLIQVLEAETPCLLFLDEIDSIAASRSNDSGQSNGNKQALTRLLIDFGRIQNSSPDIVLLAATNMPEVIFIVRKL